MLGRIRGEPPDRLLPLRLRGGRFAAARLVGGHDDVHEALEEVALRGRAGAPGELQLLVRLEEAAGTREPEAVLVASGDAATVDRHGDDPAVWGRSLHPGQARRDPL